MYGTTYYWRVRGNNYLDTSEWSSVWSFKTARTVDLLFPSNGDTNTNINITFDWTDIVGVSGYEIEIDTVDTFNSSVLMNNTLGTTSQYQVFLEYFKNTIGEFVQTVIWEVIRMVFCIFFYCC